MLFRRASDMTPEVEAFLNRYDGIVRGRLPPGFPYPPRMRDWELYQVFSRLPGDDRRGRILDTGSFATYTAFFLDTVSDHVTVSDSFAWLRRPEYMKLPQIPSLETWREAITSGAPRAAIAEVDLERMPFEDASFEFITCISTIEHCRRPERALEEMMRCLRPGGRLLLTTDHHRKGVPFDGNDRFLSLDGLRKLFAPYHDVSPDRPPDYNKKNWSYPPLEGIIIVFIELEKQAG